MATNGMKLYRYSPIKSESELRAAIVYLHEACYRLCFEAFGRYLPVRGNVGVFAHYESEYAFLTSLREKLADPKVHYKNKYYKLRSPISVSRKGEVPGADYDFLYIRRVDPYRSQVGDIDFVLRAEEHEALKARLNADTFVHGARLFGRPEENIVELWSPDVDAAAYVATSPMRGQCAVSMLD